MRESGGCSHGRRQTFGFGDTLGVGLVVGPVGSAPHTPEDFLKISKNFLRKLIKMHFRIFFKMLWQDMRLFLARLEEKHKFLGNFEKFSKIFKKFLKQFA